jgi:uncharacterized protein
MPRNLSVTPERQAEVAALLQGAVGWAQSRTDLRAIALVGSWASGTPRPDSDIDLVILTTRVDSYVATDDWWTFLGMAEPRRIARWGTVTERRVGLPSGLEVEFGIAPLTWAAIDPVDPGTRDVVRDGCRIIHDPDGLLRSLLEAVAA